MATNRRDTLAGLATVAAALALPGRAMAQTGFDGDYGGVLDTGGGKLRLRLVVSGDQVVLYSLDQGGASIPASMVKREGDRLIVDFAVIGARYEARLEGTALNGTFTQGSPLPLRLERGAIPAEFNSITDLLSGTMDAALLGKIRARLGSPAMAAAWQRRPGLAVILCDGLRAAGHPEPVRNDDRWHIGSITKSFTAALFARAVEAGAIRWDTPLGQRVKGVPAAYAKVTAIELLSHHAGLPANPPLDVLLTLPRTEADPRLSRRSYARAAMALPPVAPPRTRFAYSNVGYVLAAIMLEEATGHPWEELIRREVLRPLGLNSAGLGPPGNADRIDQPRGHGAGKPVFLDNVVAMAPAGALHIAPGDFLAYLAAHRDRPSGFLRPASWQALHRPRFGSSYALGWFVGADGALWHNGSNTAWYAEAWVEPKAGLVAATLNNDTALAARHRVLLPAIRRAAGLAL